MVVLKIQCNWCPFKKGDTKKIAYKDRYKTCPLWGMVPVGVGVDIRKG
jgi:hypothetical protein